MGLVEDQNWFRSAQKYQMSIFPSNSEPILLIVEPHVLGATRPLLVVLDVELNHYCRCRSN